nr:UvrD-like helicase, ATP-binding domain, P-loop containing nucleoside triphosphate hydrolase [Tanacetum cinerariifolium]
MGSQRSKEDEVFKIFTLVFVTNFPDQVNAKEPWNTCKQYGFVVDAFIPTRRSKAGFQKPNLGNESNPVLVLDDSCLNQQDYSYCLLGKVEIEGITLKMWSENTFKRIASKWGVLIHVDDQEDSDFHSKRICISTTAQSIISESFRITYKGMSYWIRAKEVPGWVPDFVEETDDGDESDDDDEGEPKGVMLGDSDVEAVPDTMFEVLPNANGGDAPSVGNKEMHSEDPFNIYDLLKVKKVPSADSLKYPPSFTPNDDIEDGEVRSAKRKDSTQEKDEGIQNIPEDDVSFEVRISNLKMHDKENGTDSACSGHFKKSDIPYFGGSILLVMDELVKVGQTMGYNMKGCMKNIEEIIESQEVNVVHR